MVLLASSLYLTLTNVQAVDGGNYSILVTNLAGSVLSSNALLTVLAPQTNCAAPPTGLVSWWRGEGNPLDQIGGNIGNPEGNASYAPGEVGEGFVFDGTWSGVTVGNPTNLQLQNFTIEAWIKRASTSLVSSNAGFDGLILSYGSGGYGFGLFNGGGQPLLSTIDHDILFPGAGVTDSQTSLSEVHFFVRWVRWVRWLFDALPFLPHDAAMKKEKLNFTPSLLANLNHNLFLNLVVTLRKKPPLRGFARFCA
jgi:hypothetical protein